MTMCQQDVALAHSFSPIMSHTSAQDSVKLFIDGFYFLLYSRDQIAFLRTYQANLPVA